MMDLTARHSYEDAESQKDSNYWSVTENNSNNAWNVNFNTGNVNNNNKYNSNVVRPVAACGGLYSAFYDSVVDAYKDCLRGKMASTQAVEYMQIAYADCLCGFAVSCLGVVDWYLQTHDFHLLFNEIPEAARGVRGQFP